MKTMLNLSNKKKKVTLIQGNFILVSNVNENFR